MPTGLDFGLIFNVLFFFLMGFGFIVGYIRGLKKTVYWLIVNIIIYGFFFLTIDMVINQLYSAPLGFALGSLTSVDSGFSGVQTIGEAVETALSIYLPENMTTTLSNATFMSLVASLAMFALKLVYMLFYFTIGAFLLKVVFAIIRGIFSSSRKRAKKKKAKAEAKKKKDEVEIVEKTDPEGEETVTPQKSKRQLKKEAKIAKKKAKRKEKKPFAGALVGIMKGALNAYLLLILLGGIFNIAENVLYLVPADDDQVTAMEYQNLYLDTTPVPIPVANPVDDSVSGMEEEINFAREIVAGFNSAIFVSTTNSITLSSDEYTEAVPAHLYFFDSVLSFTFQEDQVFLRAELNTFAEAANVALNSDYIETEVLSDLTGEEVASMFTIISQSDLVVNLIPLAIEVGSDFYDVEVEVPTEELYDLDWARELDQLGTIASVAFELVNTAGLLEDEPDLTTITLDGTEVEDVFESLADSELVTLAAYTAVNPLLDAAGEDIQAIITVPADMDWEDELLAFGAVAKAVLDTGITMDDFQAEDPMNLVNTLTDIDFTILLDSQIASHALKNIFSGEAGIEGLEVIVVPDGVTWFDVYDDQGNLVTQGELRNILSAVNAIADVAGGFDFDNMDLNMIADFDDPTIDTIFESEVLVATISDFLLNADLGEDMPIIIPDSALDENRYLLKAELKSVAKAAVVLVNDLACDDGDTECEEAGFDFEKAFNLEDTAIDTLTGSIILSATLGDIIIDMAGETLTIPGSSLSTISVDGVDQDVVSTVEIKSMFKAVGVLGFTDIDTMEFDASILTNLALDTDDTTLDTAKTDKLFASKIIHATISTMLFDQTEGAEAALSVPYYAEDNTTEIRVFDNADQIEYLSTDELEHILQALLTLDISDFAAVDSLDLNNVLDNSATLLESSILQATISKQMFDLGSDVLVIPYQDVDGNDIRINVGDVLEGTDTAYILSDEITNVLDGLKVLGINDINNFDGTVDLASITAEEGNLTTLLSSATIHATISDQLLSLNDDGTIVVPDKEQDDITEIIVAVGPVGNETTYIVKTEIEHMMDALDVLEILDVESFDGSVDLNTLSDPANRTTVLTSSTIQATISKQIIDLANDGTIILPYVEEDGFTPVRMTISSGVEYIVSDEIDAMIDAMNILGILDVETFDGTVDISKLMLDDNVTTVLQSATIHATISDQLLSLNTDGTIVVPQKKQDNSTDLRVTVGPLGNETEYVIKTEIEHMIDALDILGISDVESFNGTVDLNTMADETSRNTVLLSSSIQATISKQIIDMSDDGTINLPYFKDDDSTLIRVTVSSGEEYIIVDEIDAMIDAMNILGILDVETFDGTVDIEQLMIGTNLTTALASSTIQATISDQLLEMATDPSMAQAFVVPVQDAAGGTIQINVGDSLQGTDTLYIHKLEIEHMIDALDVLGITDVESFDGNIDLSPFFDETPRNELLLSAIMHATISQQIIDLDTDGTIVVPVQGINVDHLGYTNVNFNVAGTQFLDKTEVGNMFESMEKLGITDINTFSGSVDLSLLQNDADQNIILASHIIHATISKQILDLQDGSIVIPERDVANNLVKETVGLTEFVYRDEVKAMMNSLELLGITDVQNFAGTSDFNLALLDTDQKRSDLLNSATIHKTISNTIIDLDDVDDILIVPFFAEDGVTTVRVDNIDDLAFVEKVEVTIMLKSFIQMGYTNLEGFGTGIDSTKFFSDINLFVSSSTIQATLSDKMINETNNELIVPNTDLASGGVAVRIENDNSALGVANDIYVESSEVIAVMNALDLLGLTDFDAMTFDPATIFAADFNTIMNSASIQATVSHKILPTAKSEVGSGDLDEATLGQAQLIVYTSDRQALTAGVTAYTQVEKVELIELLEGLEVLGVNDFGGGMNGSTITSLTDADLQVLLTSNAMHLTVENMLRGNANILVPALAEETVAYKTDIVTRDELRYFIQSANAITGGGDFSGVSLDIATLLANMDVSNQDVIANSMLTRNTLHSDIFNANLIDPTPYAITNADYMNDDNSLFFKKQSFLDIANQLGS